MLNTRENFVFNLKRRGADPRRIVVRWPSDQEWIKRERVQVAPIRMEKGETEVLSADMDAVDAADLELFRSIRIEGDNSEDDALVIVDTLASGFMIEPGEGEQWNAIRLEALGANGIPRVPTVHYMKEPTYRLERRWNASAKSTRMTGKLVKVSFDVQFCADMYNALLDRVEGYDGPVPIIHKAEVVRELFSRLEKQKQKDSEGLDDLDPAGF